MKWKIILQFVAKNPPTILIAFGGLGWILCGFTHEPVFCDYFGHFIFLGFALQVFWLVLVKLAPHLIKKK